MKNIDDVIKNHDNFLDACLRDCLISSHGFLDTHKILTVCVTFSEFVQGITQNTKIKEESAKVDTKMGLKQAQEKRTIALQVLCLIMNHDEMLGAVKQLQPVA